MSEGAPRTSLFNPVSAILGPVFQAEVRADGRRKRSYARLSIYLLLLLAVVVVTYIGARGSASWETGAASIQSVQRIAPTIAITVGWVQFVGLGLISAALAGGSISRERTGRTLPALMTTPMPATHIVLGKLAGCTFHAVILGLLALPLLLSIRVFGGLPLGSVLGFEALTLSTVILGGALGLLGALSAKQSIGALLGGIFMLFAMQVLPPLAITLWTLNGATGPNEQILFSCSATMAMSLLTLGTLSPADVGSVWITNAWLTACAVNLALAALACGLTSMRLRPVLRKDLGLDPAKRRKARWRRKKARPQLSGSQPAETPGAPELREAGRSRRVGDDPVMWRELRHGLYGSRRKLAGILFFLVVVACFTYGRVDLRSDGSWLFWAEFDEEGPHMFIAIAGVIVMIMVAAATSATAFASEREAQTWEVLLTTRLSNLQLLRAKWLGAVRRQWLMPAVVLTVLLFAAVLQGQLPALSLVHLALILLGPIILLASTGQLLSLLCRRAATAASANLLVALGGYLAAPLALAVFASAFDLERMLESPIGDALCAMHPVAMAGIAIIGAFDTTNPTYDLIDSYELSPAAFTAVVLFGLLANCALGGAALLLAARLFPARAPRVS